jgi:hypothetical protein
MKRILFALTSLRARSSKLVEVASKVSIIDSENVGSTVGRCGASNIANAQVAGTVGWLLGMQRRL